MSGNLVLAFISKFLILSAFSIIKIYLSIAICVLLNFNCYRVSSFDFLLNINYSWDRLPCTYMYFCGYISHCLIMDSSKIFRLTRGWGNILFYWYLRRYFSWYLLMKVLAGWCTLNSAIHNFPSSSYNIRPSLVEGNFFSFRYFLLPPTVNLLPYIDAILNQHFVFSNTSQKDPLIVLKQLWREFPLFFWKWKRTSVYTCNIPAILSLFTTVLGKERVEVYFKLSMLDLCFWIYL